VKKRQVVMLLVAISLFVLLGYMWSD